MRLIVSEVRREASDVKSFTLSARDGTELPTFDPGAHIVLSLPLSVGIVADRQYSLISDSRHRTCYRIAVQRENPSRGGSAFLHDEVAVGTELDVSSPVNEFPLRSGAAKLILIAGGIGITPIVAMARQLVRTTTPFELHYAARTRDRMAFREELGSMLGGRAHFYVTVSSNDSRPDLSRILGKPDPDGHVYVCGPIEMIRAVRQIAAARGWADANIHFENFGAKRRSGDGAITVRLARSGMTIEVAERQTILDAMLTAGLWVSYDCKRGECCMCLTPVLEGQPDHRDVCLSEDDRKRYMCTCVSRVRGDRLVLDL